LLCIPKKLLFNFKYRWNIFCLSLTFISSFYFLHSHFSCSINYFYIMIKIILRFWNPIMYINKFKMNVSIYYVWSSIGVFNSNFYIYLVFFNFETWMECCKYSTIQCTTMKPHHNLPFKENMNILHIQFGSLFVCLWCNFLKINSHL
jgi:hypothetical protein